MVGFVFIVLPMAPAALRPLLETSFETLISFREYAIYLDPSFIYVRVDEESVCVGRGA